ncbi:MAG: hypothetical protein KAU03_05945, partial [Candidatus Altiarchaeales archaeon]|nr:hypothetical protein [Candidatus Altiarchaeales archaeon]
MENDAKIEISEGGERITISKDGNSARITIDKENEKATIIINNDRIINLEVKEENGKLTIYEKSRWKITDGKETYIVVREGRKLNIYGKGKSSSMGDVIYRLIKERMKQRVPLTYEQGRKIIEGCLKTGRIQKRRETLEQWGILESGGKEWKLSRGIEKEILRAQELLIQEGYLSEDDLETKEDIATKPSLSPEDQTFQQEFSDVIKDILKNRGKDYRVGYPVTQDILKSVVTYLQRKGFTLIKEVVDKSGHHPNSVEPVLKSMVAMNYLEDHHLNDFKGDSPPAKYIKEYQRRGRSNVKIFLPTEKFLDKIIT